MRRLPGPTIGRTRTPATPVRAAADRTGTPARRGVVTRSAPGFGFGPPLEPFTVDPSIAAAWCDRTAAMSLPTISRARNLICSLVGALPFTFWSVDLNATPAVERRTPPPDSARRWAVRPDPYHTRQWMLAWTVDDLIFHELAYWEITGRVAGTSGSWPSTFSRLQPDCVGVNNAGDAYEYTDPITGKARPVRFADVVVFESPIEGLLSSGWRAISIALQLDASAERFAACELPTGVLEEQEGGEDLSGDELTELAQAFAAARQANTTAATNKYLRYREIDTDASKMQLVEARQYQALELARQGNVPPYLTGAPAGTGMTYLNGQQSRQDLVDFGAAPYIGAIEQTLSGPQVLPRGTAVRLDLNAWLRNPFTTPADGVQSPNDVQIADDQTGPAVVPV